LHLYECNFTEKNKSWNILCSSDAESRSKYKDKHVINNNIRKNHAETMHVDKEVRLGNLHQWEALAYAT